MFNALELFGTVQYTLAGTNVGGQEASKKAYICRKKQVVLSITTSDVNNHNNNKQVLRVDFPDIVSGGCKNFLNSSEIVGNQWKSPEGG